MSDLATIRSRARVLCGHTTITCHMQDHHDVRFLLAEVDRQAAEIARLRNLADALAFPVEDTP